MRISKKELDKVINIVQKDSSKFDPNQPFKLPEGGNMYFDLEGSLHESLTNDKIAASATKGAQGMDYQVRVNQRGELFNNRNKFYHNDSLSLAKQMGLPTYKLIKTNEEAYRYYVMFLTKKNPASLRMAQNVV